MIDANSAPVWIAAIGLLGTLITSVFALLNQRRMLDKQDKTIDKQATAEGKLTQIHDLTNSSLSDSRARENESLAIIKELRENIAGMRQDSAVAAASKPSQTMQSIP